MTHFALLYTKINVKFNHFLFLTSSESPLNKGGSEGVWKYRWLQIAIVRRLAENSLAIPFFHSIGDSAVLVPGVASI